MGSSSDRIEIHDPVLWSLENVDGYQAVNKKE